jgi:hypothetical protein
LALITRISSAFREALAKEKFDCPRVLARYEAKAFRPKFEAADAAKRRMAAQLILFDLQISLLVKQREVCKLSQCELG